ncbi:DUF2090 domain-containing protein [Salmonella enterica subsp. enterica]|nr:DUF2090 domain-containing protein [Salmonella enterica subsp. enterica]
MPIPPLVSRLNDVTGGDGGLWKPDEMPGSYPLKLEHGDIGSQLVSWPQGTS